LVEKLRKRASLLLMPLFETPPPPPTASKSLARKAAE